MCIRLHFYQCLRPLGLNLYKHSVLASSGVANTLYKLDEARLWAEDVRGRIGSYAIIRK